MKLIKMSDFVLEKNILDEKEIKQIINYANFLKQNLKLEMFVPCDDDGNILEEINIYEKAKEKVLFKGFSMNKHYATFESDDEIFYIDEEFCENITIEDFLNAMISKLELTESAISQIK